MSQQFLRSLNSLCYNHLFATEFSSLFLILERCLFWAASVFSDEDAHVRSERTDSSGLVQDTLSIPARAP